MVKIIHWYEYCTKEKKKKRLLKSFFFFFKTTNYSDFVKTMESSRKHWEFKLVTTKKEETICFEPNYHTTKFFSKTLLVIQMKKTYIHG